MAGGKGPIRVDMYVDYQCASCKTFQMSAGTMLSDAVAADRITLVYHPLSLSIAPANMESSTRAAASAACASDMGAFLAYNNQLFADEPVALPDPRGREAGSEADHQTNDQGAQQGDRETHAQGDAQGHSESRPERDRTRQAGTGRGSAGGAERRPARAGRRRGGHHQPGFRAVHPQRHV